MSFLRMPDTSQANSMRLSLPVAPQPSRKMIQLDAAPKVAGWMKRRLNQPMAAPQVFAYGL